MSRIESGYLLIADITGYTAFLSDSELEHAQQTLSELLELLIEHTRPPLILSRLAGDAVISYALGDSFVQSQTFVELLEDTYVAFRRAIELMVLNNTCQCKACANVANLDLKFFVHYGEFGRQRLSAHDELVGSDVNLIHRLLKNRVTEATGFRAYMLITDRAIQKMALQDASDGMTAMQEEYEHLGPVKIWVQDMQPVWKARRESLQIPFPQDRVMMRVSTDIAMSPEQVWDYLAAPEHRTVLIGSDRQELLHRRAGRTTAGSAFQCYHGDRVHTHTILEWRPFERVLTQDVMDLPVRSPVVLTEYRLEPIEGGTRLSQSLTRATGPLAGRVLINTLMRVSRKQFQRDIDDFKAHIEADLADRVQVESRD